MIAPVLTSESRLMLIAPHPDDEALACSIILQRAVRANAAIRVVYVTDGDNNPWPQRVLEHKWRITAADREGWGKLRRVEALAALHVLGVRASDVRFLALPDQGLTDLLRYNCRSAIDLLRRIITNWSPTELLVPSILDTHPDHSALGVMFRLLTNDFLGDGQETFVWNFAVHGKSARFRTRATELNGSESETTTKLMAIRCHKTQLKLSRRRFLEYADRPECLLRVHAREVITPDGSARVISRQPQSLQVRFEMSIRPVPLGIPRFLVLGQDPEGSVAYMTVPVPFRRVFGGGEMSILTDGFSSTHPIFLKLDRCPIFFDEAGWLEIPAVTEPALRTVADSYAAELAIAVR
jgi:LmbE family N-acetylglucosaminyl deacetylase